jgi:purine-nucleoside phosphorylase
MKSVPLHPPSPSLDEQVREATQAIKALADIKPEIGLILGSGLGFLADHFSQEVVIPYQEIPHFPLSTITGHDGSLVIGHFEGVRCVCMKGRVHYYEGYPMPRLAFPVYVMKDLGIHTLLVTNAAGGVNPAFNVGDLMVIDDHINMLGDNPLRGPNIERFGPRFPDMSYGYDRDVMEIWNEEAARDEISLRQGVYAAMLGPSYETPAEIRMLHRIGADAVGMSTVPEVITANHCGVRVTGLSLITNKAAGILDQPLTHEEVKVAAEQAKSKLAPLARRVISRLGRDSK